MGDTPRSRHKCLWPCRVGDQSGYRRWPHNKVFHMDRERVLWGLSLLPQGAPNPKQCPETVMPLLRPTRTVGSHWVSEAQGSERMKTNNIGNPDPNKKAPHTHSDMLDSFITLSQPVIWGSPTPGSLQGPQPSRGEHVAAGRKFVADMRVSLNPQACLRRIYGESRACWSSWTGSSVWPMPRARQQLAVIALSQELEVGAQLLEAGRCHPQGLIQQDQETFVSSPKCSGMIMSASGCS